MLFTSMFATSAPALFNYIFSLILHFYKMITLIFIADNGEPIHITFNKNQHLNKTHSYGTWTVSTNYIELNDKGWEIFQTHRKEIRKLKPLLEQLIKIN
jgi:hypothetical protein